ncbi:bacteriohopanetetrol glucosamine biosynthesis glycosyltransferase HpnI [Anabaena sp. FACHB-1237]|uniref:bacteriohopanetetrol glucosamine biosynthesis glycosyltransferase HpnI n=1 Tax=Anabaena sp. FACHB-1237 TaxID=2692769 RepID=UPI001F55A315|nr:bacteriohopanetetrol glucosamine biosynthesis glycosyltransferase HpnI [Anabaena sp. FACHB-1237]
MLILSISAILFYCYGVYAAIAFSHFSDPINPNFHPPVTILKPLCGVDTDSYENLVSFIIQDYPQYQIIFTVRDEKDPIIQIVHKLIEEYPNKDISLVIKNDIIGANLKISNLANGYDLAKYDILVIADSDIRVNSDYLNSIIPPLQDENVGVVTCLYRSQATGITAILEAIGTATDFQPCILVSKQLQGVKFAFGSTIVIRKNVLLEIGGLAGISDYLADDYQLGYLPSQLGYKVILSNYIVTHNLAKSKFLDSLNRQIRWAKCVRVSRPGGYTGLMFTFGTISSLILLIISKFSLWGITLLFITWLCRFFMAWVIGIKVINDEVTKRYFWLIPVWDVVRFSMWIYSFFGNKITWMGKRFALVKGGKLVMLKEQEDKYL